MVPYQFIIAVVVHDIFKAGDCDKPHGIVLQVAVYGLEHGTGVRLVLQEIKGQEYVIQPACKPRILCFRKPFRHIQPLGPCQLHQMGIMFYAVNLHRKFRQNL